MTAAQAIAQAVRDNLALGEGSAMESKLVSTPAAKRMADTTADWAEDNTARAWVVSSWQKWSGLS